MKYRRLTQVELLEFEKEFIDFLVVNGILADDWVKMKESGGEDSEKIIEAFSDVILEGILRKINFLELKSPQYFSAIQCLSDKMIQVALTSIDGSVDLKSIPSFKGLNIHRLEKKYDENREKTLFELTKKGYQISDGKLFKELLISSIKS